MSWKALITDAGNELSAKTISGGNIKLTHAKAGSGTISEQDLHLQTELVNVKQTLSIESIKYSNAVNNIEILLDCRGLKEAYDLTQIGIYATDPDAGEILFAIAQTENPKHIPAENEVPFYSIDFNFAFALKNNQNMVATIDQSTFATKEQLSAVDARIDNIIVNAGSTEDNAELIDMRVDVDGKRHSTAGEALRSQLKQKANLTDISSPYQFKGACLSANLPGSGNKINDTYYVTDKKCKFTWNGAAWYQSSLNESDYEEELSSLTEELSNLLEEGTQILDWKNAKVVNGYFTSISDFKSSDVSRTVIIPVDYSKGDTISIHRGIMGERFVYGYTSIEMPKIGDILDYANVQNNAERVILRIKSDTKNILLYYYNSTLDNYDSDDILASIMVQYGKVYTGYEPYGEPRGKKDIINKINGNSEKLISAVYNSPSIFDDVSNPISKGDHFYLYVKDIVGAKYSDIEFYFFRSDNTYKRVIHNINIGELYAITADEDYTKYRIRIVVESTTSNDMIYAIYNIFQSNGISAINISAKVYDLALDNNKKVEQLTANNLNTCNIFRKVIACGDSYTAGYIVSKTGEIHNVNEEYAWPHYMETITGNTWVNCGHSGANAYTWQTAERGLPKAKASGKAQAYILGLMINDSSTDSTRNLKLGTISDIGTDEISYYGQYTKIIKELFNISPNAKVFIETCPKVEGDRYIGYNQAVYDIYDKLKPNYPNLHLLDLFKHYSMYTNASLTKDSLSGHYTAIGYQQFAQILSVILSSYINEHISDFQDVAFIEYDN
jgi:hypothetical protein